MKMKNHRISCTNIRCFVNAWKRTWAFWIHFALCGIHKQPQSNWCSTKLHVAESIMVNASHIYTSNILMGVVQQKALLITIKNVHAKKLFKGERWWPGLWGVDHWPGQAGVCCCMSFPTCYNNSIEKKKRLMHLHIHESCCFKESPNSSDKTPRGHRTLS